MRNLLQSGRILSLGLAAFAISASAEIETLTYVPQGGYPGAGTAAWLDQEGNAVAWKSGSIAVMNPGGSNRGLFFALDAYKLVVSPGSNTGYWWDGGSGSLKIGAGGVEFTAPCFWAHIHSGLMNKVTLTADQTWANNSPSGKARFALGSQMSWNGNMYNKARISAANGVTAWNLTGDLEVWLYSPENQLQDVTVTVSDAATINLVSVNDAHLNAKRLVLDGATMAFGAYIGTDTSGYKSYTVTQIDAAHVSEDVELKDGATLTFEDSPFAIPRLQVSGTGNALTGTSLTVAQAETEIAFAAEGAELDVNASLKAAVAATLNVTGAGTLGIVADREGALPGGSLVLGAETRLKVSGEGRVAATVVGGAALEVAAASGSILSLADRLAGYTGNELVVSSGTLLLGTMGELPVACTVRTEGDGEVLFASAEGYDPGRVTGTKNVRFSAGADIFVTDSVVSAKTLSIGSEQTLHVYGNGLTEETALTLAGGTVLFHATATISSPVVVTASTKVQTDVETVTGTFAGFCTSQSATSGSYGLKIYGDGKVCFAGGGSFAANADTIGAYGGELLFTGGAYAFASSACIVLSSTGAATQGKWCHRMLVADGATLTFADRNSMGIYAYSRTNGSYYFDEVVVEVAEGGVIDMQGQTSIQLGGNQAKARVLLSGGTWKMGTGSFQFGGSAMGTGVIQIDSGVLETAGSFLRPQQGSVTYQDQGRFIFNGGTLRLLPGTGGRFLFGLANNVTDKTKLRAWMCVDGADCTIDVAPGLTITNVPPNVERSEWFGHGKLTVTGGGTFVMNAVAEDVALALAGEGTSVKIAGEALVYNDSKCRTTMNVDPYKDKYLTLPPENGYLRDSLALRTLGLDGIGTSLAVEGPLPVAATDVQVGATGEWNSSWSVLGDSVTLQDITFAENAIIGASKAADGSLKRVVFPGTMTLPAAMRYSGRQLGGGGNVLSAASVVGRTPTLIPCPDNRAGGVDYDAETGFWFRPAGALLLIR